MPDIKNPIALTHASMEKMSRHELLKWVNTIVQGEYKKIEELCSGVAYCQMMEMLFPQSVCMKKVKLNPKLEHEYLHNLKQFQLAFTRINYEKSVPIERLMKGRFQDNFEFLQWFKKFFNVHAAGKENLKAIVLPAQATKTSVRRSIGTPPLKTQAKVATMRKEADSTKMVLTPLREQTAQPSGTRSVSSNSLLVLQETRDQLSKQLATVKTERNSYYTKLTIIEKAIKNSLAKDEHVDWCKKCLNILYTADAAGTSSDKVEQVNEFVEL